MGALDFGLKCLRIYAGADSSRLALREEDHNQPYRGTKIPTSVTLSATYRCNLNCRHCQSENDRNKPDIPTDRFLRLIDEIADAGATKVGFTGGEPLVRKDFGELVTRCQEKGLLVSVVSNSWLVKKRIDTLKGINLLFLSVDGNREVHDRIRGPGSWDKFLEAVDTAKSNGIPVAALTTLMSHNHPCLQEMADTFTELGIHWMAGLIQTEFTARTEQDLSAEQVRDMASILSRAPCLRTSKRYLRFMTSGKPMDRCFAGIGYCIVGPDAILYPCFPAQFDHENYRGVANPEVADRREAATAPYSGVDLMTKTFGQAFEEMPLYRRTCRTCALACHAEANYLHVFDPGAILQSFHLMRAPR
ncbi:radical SAM protein [Elusimicrobiota bacterium]